MIMHILHSAKVTFVHYNMRSCFMYTVSQEFLKCL